MKISMTEMIVDVDGVSKVGRLVKVEASDIGNIIEIVMSGDLDDERNECVKYLYCEYSKEEIKVFVKGLLALCEIEEEEEE